MGNEVWPSVELSRSGVAVLDCEHKTPPDAGEGYPYIAIPDIVDGRIELRAARRITGEHLAEWTRRTKPRNGDVVVTRRGRVGATAPIPDGVECAIGQNLVLLRSDGQLVSQRYLRWAVRGRLWASEVDRLRNVGAVFDSLNVRDIPGIRIPVPPRRHQLAIADVLAALDDKIESNRRLALNLTDLLRLVYDETVRSARRCVTLGELGHVVGGGTPRSSIAKYWEPHEVAWVTPKDMTALAGNPCIWHGERWISQAGLDASSAKLVPPGSVLYTSRATLGLIAIAQRELATNQGFITLVPRNGLSSTFVYSTLRARSDAIRAMANGATFLEVNKTNFKQVECPMPEAEQLAFHESIANPAVKRIAALMRESRTLTAIRDALLPKLVSGQIRVPLSNDLEEQVGAAIEALA